MDTQSSSHIHSRRVNGSANGFARKSQAWDFDHVCAPKEDVLRKLQVTEKG